MGRETKILLGFLAMLAGVFLGVLAVKLLVPRPPAGAGPDIRTEVAVARPIELVEPPSLDPPSTSRRRFASPAADVAAPYAAAGDAGAADFPIFEPTREPAAAAPAAPQHAPPAAAAAAAPHDTAARAPARISRDPFVSRASYDPTVTDTAAPRSPPLASPRPDASAAPRYDAAGVPAAVPAPQSAAAAPAFPAGQPQPASAPEHETAAGYHCQPGDSWWSLAERAYGDGRLYRALFAWNRTIDPRVSLAPGTRLELPPRARLEAAWPKLLPGPAGH